jgi:HD-GYP domain-containing protein (c-di-GMP phosphodiesterase class II)
MTSSGISPAVKTATTFNRGHSLLERISDHRKDLNIPIDEILNFSQDIRRLFDQLDLNDARDFQALMQNVALYEHSLGTTVLSILLAKPMELDKEQSADILGIASFLHDIGLARMPPAVQSEDLSKMIGDQRELYFQHPALGAQILRDTNSVHPVAIQVVAQHHERRNGTGFPNRLVGQQIHKLSEVVGFSEELARLVQSRPGAPIKNVLIEMKSLSFEAYSLQIIEAFLKIFDPLLK